MDRSLSGSSPAQHTLRDDSNAGATSSSSSRSSGNSSEKKRYPVTAEQPHWQQRGRYQGSNSLPRVTPPAPYCRSKSLCTGSLPSELAKCHYFARASSLLDERHLYPPEHYDNASENRSVLIKSLAASDEAFSAGCSAPGPAIAPFSSPWARMNPPQAVPSPKPAGDDARKQKISRGGAAAKSGFRENPFNSGSSSGEKPDLGQNAVVLSYSPATYDPDFRQNPAVLSATFNQERTFAEQVPTVSAEPEQAVVSTIQLRTEMGVNSPPKYENSISAFTFEAHPASVKLSSPPARPHSGADLAPAPKQHPNTTGWGKVCPTRETPNPLLQSKNCKSGPGPCSKEERERRIQQLRRLQSFESDGYTDPEHQAELNVVNGAGGVVIEQMQHERQLVASRTRKFWTWIAFGIIGFLIIGISVGIPLMLSIMGNNDPRRDRGDIYDGFDESFFRSLGVDPEHFKCPGVEHEQDCLIIIKSLPSPWVLAAHICIRLDGRVLVLDDDLRQEDPRLLDSVRELIDSEYDDDDDGGEDENRNRFWISPLGYYEGQREEDLDLRHGAPPFPSRDPSRLCRAVTKNVTDTTVTLYTGHGITVEQKSCSSYIPAICQFPPPLPGDF
ncbi:uncharacterized protein LOC135821839 [Sycon ciliatum]|uniref:uncharacterized protein LOC135821839 n=1 Tax=Sycon ciliatum TaxID=27933 RepID=UPI0031F61ED0